MGRLIGSLLLTLFALPGLGTGGGYDFYANTRYPGPGRRPDVDIYKVVRPGASDPRAYERREVLWWPRRGVDVIEVEPGMPLRTWTWRRGPLEAVSAEAQGKPTRERWEKLEAKQNVGEFFYRRVRGFLHPPKTGQYTFFIAADDRGWLYLSTDERPEHKRRIAGLSEYSRFKQFERHEGQISLPVRLEAGKRYYIEVTHEEDRWNDHVEVAWKGPGLEEPTIIAGAFLSSPDGKRGEVVVETWPVSPPGRRQPHDAPRRFKAHLIGFRGIGNTMSDKFRGDGGPLEPAVVLRLPDGRKRCFPRGSFSLADKKFIMDLYVKEMERIKATLDKTRRIKPPRVDIEWPNNARPGEPGTMQVESEHFVWCSGSQAGGDDDPWANERDPEKAEWYRRGSVECAEAWWALNEYAGHLMPFWDRPQQFKYVITVPGTKRDGYKYIGGYAGGGYGGCAIKAAGGGPWAMALFHEWGHGALSNSWRVGGGEAQADAHQCLADPGVLKGNPQIRAPWRNIFNGGMGYGRTVFYTGVADDPNWGYNWFACLPAGVEENSTMQIVARVGEQRGLFDEGIRGFGDLMGEYGARLATFDRELEDTYRRAYFAPARNWLEAVDLEKRIYRIPLDEAPEPFGVNIVRLVPDEGARQITVDFMGLHDPDSYSDWRACIVAFGADGKRRYSPLWNRGKMTLECRPGDRSYWLTVAATPRAIYNGRAVNYIYNGRFAFHYPWSVRLTGARPGTPRHCRADFNDADLVCRLTDPVPAPHDTEVGKRFLKKLMAFEDYLDKAEARTGDSPIIRDRIARLKDMVRVEMDRMTKGKRHPNGGGWVQATAKVAPTAYVGPNAMVLDSAQVLDSATVEDFAVVAGKAVVSGHARVSGQAVVKGSARVGGYARTWKTLDGSAVATVVPLRGRAKELHKFGLLANYAMDRPEKTILEDWYRFEGESHDGYLYGHPEFATDAEHKGFRFDGKTQYAELSPRVADLGEMTVDISLKPESQGAQAIFDFGASPRDRLVLRTDPKGRPQLVARVGGKTVLSLTAKEPLRANQWARLRVEIDGEHTSLWLDGKKAAELATSFRPCDVFPPGLPKRNFIAAARDGASGFRGIIDFVAIYHTVHDDYSKVPPLTKDAPRRPTADFIAALEKKYGAVAVLNARANALARKTMAPYERLFRQCREREQELLNRSPDYRKVVANLKAAEEAAGRRKRELAEEFDKLPENARTKTQLQEMRGKVDAMRRQVRDLERKFFGQDQELVGLEAQHKEAENKRRAREQELRKEFDSRPDVAAKRAKIAELRKQADQARRQSNDARKADELRRQAADLDRELRDLWNAFYNQDTTIQELNTTREKLRRAIAARQAALRAKLNATEPLVRQQKKVEQEYRALERAFRTKRDLYVAKGAADATRKIAEAQKTLQEATAKAWRAYEPEHVWLFAFVKQSTGGYYNSPYRWYIAMRARQTVGGGELRDDLNALKTVLEAQSDKAHWHTRVDWDWRMPQEIDGSIRDLPLMHKWLERVRGPVVTQKPKGAT